MIDNAYVIHERDDEWDDRHPVMECARCGAEFLASFGGIICPDCVEKEEDEQC